MALETPTAASPASEAQAPAKSPAPAVTRARNEYPEAYDQLEELERAQPAKPDKAAPAAKPAAAKPATSPAPKPPGVDKAAPKPPQDADKATPADKLEKPSKPEKTDTDLDADEEDPTAKFHLAHDLRKEFRKLYKVVQEKDRVISEFQSKAESAPVNAAMMEESKALKKRLEEVENELRYVEYTKSAEFKDKFEKPYQDAYDDAVEEVKELRVNLPDGNTRPATSQDFQRILQADQQDVRALANDLFGDAANDVLAARRRLVDMNRQANRESKRYREQAAERERQKVLKQTEEKEQLERLWNRAVKSIPEKYPEYFSHVDGDDEYNKELDAGYQTVDRAHAPNLPLEEKVARLAALRHRAAAFRAQVLVNKRLKSRVSELEEVVAGYEKSAPTGGSGSESSRVPTGDGEESFTGAMEELDELGRKDTAE